MVKATFLNLPEEKRARIVELAIEEFSDNPYRQASLSRIVSRAGIAKGSIYQYFDNKLDLYRWLVTKELQARKLALFEANIDPSASFFEQLEASALLGLRFARAEPRLARLGANLIEWTVDPELAELNAEVRETSHAYLREMVEQAQASGELRPSLDPDIAVELVSQLLGRGLVELMMRRQGLDLEGFLAGTDVAQLSDEELESLVHEIIEVLRAGMGV